MVMVKVKLMCRKLRITSPCIRWKNVVCIQKRLLALYIQINKDEFILLYEKPMDLVITYMNQEIDKRTPKDQRFN